MELRSLLGSWRAPGVTLGLQPGHAAAPHTVCHSHPLAQQDSFFSSLACVLEKDYVLVSCKIYTVSISSQ